LTSSAIAEPKIDLVQEKLAGPVTDFVNRSFTYFRMPFAADLTKQISYVVITGADPTIAPLVVVPGRGSHAYFWAETMYDFRQLGYTGDIYIWDAPGQGLSDRILPSQPLTGDIKRFADYSDSFIEFLTMVNGRYGVKPKVIGHSMGGAIALLALEQHPELADRVLAAAPMLDIRFSGNSVEDTTLTKLALAAGQVPGVRDTAVEANAQREELPEREDNSRNDRIRFTWAMEDAHGTRLPGKTLGWVAQAIMGGNDTIAGAGRLTLPVKIFLAENDTVVDSLGAKKLLANCANCESEVVPHALHALVEDVDTIRTPLVQELFDWLNL
jgi:lysophospholipase